MIAELEARGVEIIETVEHAPKDGTIVIRAHGVPQGNNGQHCASACGLFRCNVSVCNKNSQNSGKESAKGQTIIIIGDARHPEIIGNTWTLQQQMLYCKQCAGAAKFVRIRAKFGQSAD